MTVNVALIGEIPAGAVETLKERVTERVNFVPVPNSSDADQVRRAVGDADVVIGQWPESIESAPNVELVQQIGSGVESYDRDQLPAGAYLCNVYGHADAIAEHVMLLLLALQRDLLTLDADLRRGKWGDTNSIDRVDELRAGTLGVVGFGNIGQALVEPAQCFGLDVAAVRSQAPQEAQPDGVEFVGGPDDLPRILRESDAVVLAVPLTDATRGMIGEEELSLMGEDAFLINVARGPVVEERALYEVLDAGTIGGAGIDTWYRYPDGDEPCQPSDYPFHELDNIVMTPHIAGCSRQTADYRWSFIAGNIDRVVRGEEPENVVYRVNQDR